MDDLAASSSSFPNLSNTISGTFKNNTPCLKHTMNNLVEKSTDLSSTVSLCKNCSKSMLSYIFLIQEVLDNLAKAIYCGENSSCCVQCLRQEFNVNAANCNQSTDEDKTETIENSDKVLPRKSSSDVSEKPDVTEIEDKSSKPSKKSSSRRNSRRLSRELRCTEKEPLYNANTISFRNQQDWKVDFLYNVTPSTSFANLYQDKSSEDNEHKTRPITILNEEYCLKEQFKDTTENIDFQIKPTKGDASAQNYISVATDAFQTSVNDETTLFKRNGQQNEMLNISFIEDYKPDTLSAFEQFVEKENFLENYNEVEGTVPFSNCDVINKEALLQSKTAENVMEAPKQSASVEFSKTPATVQAKIPTEAFVTICRNNSEALGCLVLGSSLLLSRTTRALCVLLFDGVHSKFKELLSSVFHVVQDAICLETSKSTETKWHQRQLEKSMDKLNIWRLVQFDKCVFLNPDTLVLRNCDELFKHDELSAVPDNGWPDCFNNGVFVFVPSLSTLSQMEEMIQKQGHNDGGDQIFLNSFFTSWSSDLSKKLSFIYNLNLLGTTTYTYATAYHNFGQDVKIVQFSGYFKPWHVRFYNETSQIVDASNILSTSIRFICEWISIFRVSVLRLFPQKVYSRIFGEKTISADEISMLLRFSERYEDRNHRTSTDDTQENHKNINVFGERIFRNSPQAFSVTKNRFVENESFSDTNESEVYLQFSQGPAAVEEPEHTLETSEDFGRFQKKYNDSPLLDQAESLLPNSLINQCLSASENYEAMKVWEQGKMDYEGEDNSEDLIKRLQLIIA